VTAIDDSLAGRVERARLQAELERQAHSLQIARRCRKEQRLIPRPPFTFEALLLLRLLVGDGVAELPPLLGEPRIRCPPGHRPFFRLVRPCTTRHPRDVRKRPLAWAAGSNWIAVPVAAGVFSWAGISLSPAVGAILMSASTIVVAFNAQLLRRVDLRPRAVAEHAA
jgi:hypothetical protein